MKRWIIEAVGLGLARYYNQPQKKTLTANHQYSGFAYLSVKWAIVSFESPSSYAKRTCTIPLIIVQWTKHLPTHWKKTDPRPRNRAVLMEELLPEKNKMHGKKNNTLPFEIVWILLTNILIRQAHHGLPLSSSTTSPSSSCRKSWDVDRSWLVDGIGHIGDYAGQLYWGLK